MLNVLKDFDHLLLDFSNCYMSTNHNSDVVIMSRRIKEMEENNSKLQQKAQEMQQKVIELSMRQSKFARPTTTTCSVNPVILTLILVILM